MKYEVQMEIGNDWENVWKIDDQPETFPSREAAKQAIKDHIIDCINAVEGGDMADSPDPSDFRVVEVV